MDSSQNPLIEGIFDQRFEGVRDAFEQNFLRRGEHGAAIAVNLEGELVVDLWGGWRDAGRTRPWEADTLVNTQSTAKGVMATVVHLLVDKGSLSWDMRVAEVWPEFGQAGKAEITVRQLMSHQAGLCVIDTPLPPGATLHWPRIVHALETQRPAWLPGTRFGYHAVTWSFLVGELVRRATGRTLSNLFSTEFGRNWKLDFHLGLPAHAAGRTAEFLRQPTGKNATPVGADTPYKHGAFQLCEPLPGTTTNSPEVRAAPTQGFGTAKSLARLYGGLACGGKLEDHRCLSEHATSVMGETIVEGEDAVLGSLRRFGLGFWLHYPTRNAVRGLRAFGHPGLGGSFAFADPDRRLSVAYVMNLPGAFLRAANLELAVYKAMRAR